MNICFVDARYCVCVEGGSQESLRAVWIGSGRGSGRHWDVIHTWSLFVCDNPQIPSAAETSWSELAGLFQNN